VASDSDAEGSSLMGEEGSFLWVRFGFLVLRSYFLARYTATF
jgi:hypothetical protein